MAKEQRKSGQNPWANIGGIDAARDRLIEGLVLPLRQPTAMQRLGIRAAKGFLLYGPAGLGKSLLARAAAQDAGAQFLSLSAPNILSLPPGEGEAKLEAACTRARQEGPAVLFIDELDLLAPVRSTNASEPQRNERLVNVLLAEIDRLATTTGIAFVGSTSRPTLIDPVLLRPGRLDELIYCAVPGAAGRKEILAMMTASVPLAKDVRLDALVGRTERFTAADIEDLVRRAGLNAIKISAAAKKIAMADFEAALGSTRASVTEAMEKDYEKVQGEIKQNAMKLEPAGFFSPGQLKPVRDSKHGTPVRA